jgi:ribosomal protein S18 acetylase RimI-like enzyme
MKIVECLSKDEMLENLNVIKYLHINLSMDDYDCLLDKIIPHNYAQIIVLNDENERIGISGFWVGHKIWSGKYLEIDNFVVHPEYRSQGVGELMTNYLTQKAKQLDCDMLGLDVYTNNFNGVRFYMNQGFDPTGFHMIKKLK